VYGFLIEHYASAGNFRASKSLIDELRAVIPNVNLAYYVNTDALASVERAVGVRLQPGEGEGGRSVEEDHGHQENDQLFD